MANQLFKNFPELQYTLNTGKIITVKDFFRKGAIEQESVNSFIEYSTYELLDGERPDVVATKLYGDGELHWTIFLVNQLDNYYDWHMDGETFERYINEKFMGQTITAINISDIISSTGKFLIGERVTTNTGTVGNVIDVDGQKKQLVVSGVFQAGDIVTGATSGKSFTIQTVKEHKDDVDYFINSDKVIRNFGGSGWTEVSHYDAEWTLNENRRKIKVIRPNKIKRVVAEFERVMSNG